MAKDATQRARRLPAEVGVRSDELDRKRAIGVQRDGLRLVAVKPAILGEDDDLLRIALVSPQSRTTIRRPQRERDLTAFLRRLGLPRIARVLRSRTLGLVRMSFTSSLT